MPDKATADPMRVPRPGDPPHLRQIHGRDEAGRPICNARGKRGPCKMGAKNPAQLFANGRCRLHGGPSTGPPILNPTDRQHSVLDRLRGDCARLAAEESNLLDSRVVLAKLNDICQRLEDRVTSGEPPEFRKRAMELYSAAQEAGANNKPEEAALALRRLGALLREGVSVDRALESWAHNLERLGRRIEAALGTRIQMDRAMTERDMQKALTAWLGLLLDQFADDPSALRVISAMTRGVEFSMGQVYPEHLFPAATPEPAPKQLAKTNGHVNGAG